MERQKTDTFWDDFTNKYRGKRGLLVLWYMFILFPLIFFDKTVQTINKTLVNPLFSTLNRSTLLIDFIFLSAGILVLIILGRKASKKIYLSSLIELSIISLTYIYALFRFSKKNVYDFTTFRIGFLKNLYLGDTIFLFFSGLILYYLISICKQYVERTKPNRNEKKEANSFSLDSAIILDQKNDTSGRLQFIEQLVNKIDATDSPLNSFSIGIIGAWGSGKTTFLRTMEHSFKRYKNVIQLQFNPWVGGSSVDITSLFLSDLAAAISKYDDSLRSEIGNYAKELINILNVPGFPIIEKLMSSSFGNRETYKRFEDINKHIRRLNRKIIVYIDDVDRLHANEVTEVLKLIRNTANFSNTFFIVAYDKRYITACINTSLNSNSEAYAEKIFQLEYYLPVNSDQLIYRKELLQRLEIVVPDSAKPVVAYMKNPEGLTPSGYETLPEIERFITSYRDVKRFMNLFNLNFDLIKNNVYLPDFISITLLKLKYPEVYRLLYYQRRRYLTTNRDSTEFFESDDGKLMLRYKDKLEHKLENSALHHHLSSDSSKYALSNGDVIEAVALVYSIFSEVDSGSSFSGRRSLYNNHLSVSNSLFFHRYFDFSMVGRIDQTEFEGVFKLSFDNLAEKIMSWNVTRELSRDLLVKIEKFDRIDDVEIFEKLIRAMVLIGYLPIPGNERLLHSFNLDDFYKRLGGRDDDSNYVVHRIYHGDKEKFRIFLGNLYFSQPFLAKWTFIHEFAKELIKSHNDDFVLSHLELRDLIKRSFLYSLSTARFSGDTMLFYNNVIRLFQKDENEAGIIAPTGEGVEISEKLQQEIAKDIAVFLKWNIYQDGPAKIFYTGNWDKVIFGSKENFKNFLMLHKDNPVVREYMDFEKEFIKSGRAIPFSFSKLDI